MPTSEKGTFAPDLRMEKNHPEWKPHPCGNSKTAKLDTALAGSSPFTIYAPADDAFKNLHRKFFDPFEYYIESLGLKSNGLYKQERTFIDSVGEKVHYFIFNTYLEDFDNERIKITNLVSDNPDSSVIVYSPIKLELTHSKLNLFNGEKVEIIDIEPKELFILLVMYKENFDLQPKLGEIISNYTRQKL